MKKISTITERLQTTPLYWIFISVVVIYLDYLSGPTIQFPILYLIPILLASWHHRIIWSISLAVILSMIRPLFIPLWEVVHWSTSEMFINALIRGGVFILFAILINKISSQKQELERELNTLKGILPICSFCKKIRKDDDTWDTLEKYISEHSEAKFSHGMCPECAKKNYPDYFDE